jgi:small conductance mechanosensitive channel
MFEKVHFQEILHKIPLVHASLTAGLFLVTLFVSKLTKRLIKKRASRKPAEKKTFWLQFWKSEQKFILKSVGWILWLLYFMVVLFIWSDHLAKVFLHLEHLYAPLARAIVIVIIAAIAIKAINQLIHYSIEQITPLTERRTNRGKQRAETLNHIFKYGSTIIILLVTVLMLLDTFGIDLKAALATLGVASLAVGFGAQSLVKDVVSGIFILIEDQYAVGDVIILDGEGGFVEKMTLRITQLRNTEGMLITIPNGNVGMVKNLTSEWSRVDYMMDVAYETDLDYATEVIMDECRKLHADMPNDIIDEPILKGVDSFNDSSITIRVWIRTKPLMQWDVKRELNRRIHKRFDKEGITIPFPQRTVWIKEPNEQLFAEIAKNK